MRTFKQIWFVEYRAKTIIFEHKIWFHLHCIMKDYDPTIRFKQIISTAYIRVTQKILMNQVYESLKIFCEFPCCKKLFRASHWRQSKVLLYVLYYCISLSLRNRQTVFVDSVEHSLSVWDSVKGTKNAFDISLIRKRRVFGIGDIAAFLVWNTRRLNSWTANKSAGNWAFKKFEIQSSILFKLFWPYFWEVSNDSMARQLKRYEGDAFSEKQNYSEPHCCLF